MSFKKCRLEDAHQIFKIRLTSNDMYHHQYKMYSHKYRRSWPHLLPQQYFVLKQWFLFLSYKTGIWKNTALAIEFWWYIICNEVIYLEICFIVFTHACPCVLSLIPAQHVNPQSVSNFISTDFSRTQCHPTCSIDKRLFTPKPPESLEDTLSGDHVGFPVSIVDIILPPGDRLPSCNVNSPRWGIGLTGELRRKRFLSFRLIFSIPLRGKLVVLFARILPLRIILVKIK